jgi:heterotetrameric sarcosine oxidase gamma subunit
VADITLSEATGFGMATVLPLGEADCAVPGVTLLHTAPGVWLAHAAQAGPDWADWLATSLAGRAHVVDQSGAYGLFVVEGMDGRRLLQKGLPVDLDPAVLSPGGVVVGAMAHIGVVLHHAGQSGASARFHLFTYRSFMGSLRHWLETARAGL